MLSDLFKVGPGLSFSVATLSCLVSNALVLSETFPVGTITVSSSLTSLSSSPSKTNLIYIVFPLNLLIPELDVNFNLSSLSLPGLQMLRSS